MNFTQCLELGQAAERQLAQLFTDNGYTVTFNESNKLSQLQQYDFTVAGKITAKIEVKWDVAVEKTNNIALEIPSLLKSTADYVFYKIFNEFYCIEKSKLDKLLRSSLGRNVYGGDRKQRYLKLLPLSVFKQYFTFYATI